MRCRKVFRFFLTFFLIMTCLSLWTAAAERQAHYMPNYEREDLMPFLELESWELTEDDYRRLFFQTGLAKAGVDELYEAGRQELLLDLQERFFADVQVKCFHANPLLRSERLVEKAGVEDIRKRGLVSDMEEGAVSRETGAEYRGFIPVIQDGDIIVTFSGHVFGWRCGHAAVVVKASEGQTLEAVTYGCDSAVCSVGHWNEYPCFALLRLKGITAGQQAEIAEYAMAEFLGVPYSLFAFTGSGRTGNNTGNSGSWDAVALRDAARENEGLRKKMSVENADAEGVAISCTQCAHLVWAVYRHFGYDLDSDGGAVVTPADLFYSDMLEVVQIYGINPENLINF